MEQPINFYRQIGDFFKGTIVQFYSINGKDYILSQTGRSYKVLNLVDLKIKYISPTFE